MLGSIEETIISYLIVFCLGALYGYVSRKEEQEDEKRQRVKEKRHG